VPESSLPALSPTKPRPRLQPSAADAAAGRRPARSSPSRAEQAHTAAWASDLRSYAGRGKTHKQNTQPFLKRAHRPYLSNNAGGKHTTKQPAVSPNGRTARIFQTLDHRRQAVD
jgi:hypothetical protein